MKVKKPCYIADFFKNLYFIPTLLISAISFFILYFGYNQNTISKIINSKGFLIYICALFGVFITLSVINCFFNFKKNINFADSIIFTFVLVPIAYVVFLFLIAKAQLNLYRLIAPILLFIIGVLLLILRWVKYTPKEQVDKPFYQNGVFKTYYKILLNKFSFFSILALAFFIVCFFFIFSIKVFLSNELYREKFYIIAIILLPLILYIATSIPSKKVIEFDMLSLSLLISLPIIIIQFIFVEKAINIELYSFAILFIATIIVTIIRLKAVDFTYLGDKPVEKINKPIKNYLVQVFNKYNILLVLALGSITAFILILTQFYYANIFSVVKKENGVLTFIIASVPFIFVNLVLFSSLIISGFLGLINIKNKEINYGDFCLMYCVSFIIFAFICSFLHFSLYVITASTLALIVIIAIISSRIRHIN